MKKWHEKMQKIDSEAGISKEVEMKTKFNRNQKRISPWGIQLKFSNIFVKTILL